MRSLSFTIISLAILLCSCGESAETRQTRTKAEREKAKKELEAAFKVGVMPTMDCLPVFLLKDSMLYDTAKVDIRLKMFTAQMDCDTALAGGSIQGAVTDVVRASRLNEQGTPLLAEMTSNAYWQLIANKKARLRELSQFSDKMIAMTRYSVTDMLTDMAVERGKTKYPVYKVQINDVFIRLRMLLNNEMDAVWLTEPQATRARQTGNNVVMDTRKENVKAGIFAFRSKDMEQKTRLEELDEFKKAYNRACDSINKNGVRHYSALIEKYMHADKKTVGRLPDMKYEHSHRPSPEDMNKAQKWLNSNKK